MFIFVSFFHFFASVLVPIVLRCATCYTFYRRKFTANKKCVRFEDVAIVQMNKFAANYSHCIQSDLFRSCKSHSILWNHFFASLHPVPVPTTPPKPFDFIHWNYESEIEACRRPIFWCIDMCWCVDDERAKSSPATAAEAKEIYEQPALQWQVFFTSFNSNAA